MNLMSIILCVLVYMMIGYHAGVVLKEDDETMFKVMLLAWPAVIVLILIYIIIDKLTWRR